MALIPIRSRAGIVDWAAVDAEDYDEVMQFSWARDFYGYAFRACRKDEPGANIAMHRQLLGLVYGDPRVIHHRDEDKLNNRRGNLEVFANASEHARTPHRYWRDFSRRSVAA